MDRNAEILDLMRMIAKNESGIRLVNLYKGLPIIYEATITAIEPTTLRLLCNKYQLACLYLTHEVYVIGQDIRGTIHADVTGLIPARDEAILANLAYVEKPFILRDQIRVEPTDPMKAVLQLKGSLSTIETQLADISLDGLGVYIDRNSFHPKLFLVGNNLTVILPLTDTLQTRPMSGGPTAVNTGDLSTRFTRESMRGLAFMSDDPQSQRRPVEPMPVSGKTKLTAQGTIVNIRPELLKGRYRLGLRLLQEDRVRFIISQFISNRQSEIIREFRTVYDSLTRNDKPKTS